MKAIVKNVFEWVNLFKRIQQLKEIYGSTMFDETIFLLQQIKNYSFGPIKNKVLLLDLLVEHGIDNIDLMIIFLNQSKSIYQVDSVALKIDESVNRYGIHQIAFMLDSKPIVEVDSFCSNLGFKKVYFPSDVIPKVEIDYQQGKIKNTVSHCEFIADEQNFLTHQTLRTYYTSDFRFSCMSLPLKEEMDHVNIEHEKKEWMDVLMKELCLIDPLSVHLEVIDPNQLYHSFSEFNHYCTIITDGEIRDVYGNSIPAFYGNKDIVVSQADVLMMCQINCGEVQNIRLVVHPTYFKQYVEGLQNDKNRSYLCLLERLLDSVKSKDRELPR